MTSNPTSIRLVAVAILVLATGVASADSPITPSQPKAPILVLESHVGSRDPEVARLMATLDEALETYGFAARPTTILKLVNDAAPRPGSLDEDENVNRVAQKVDAGYVAFTRGDFTDAKKELTAAIEIMRRNPATFALNTSNTDLAFKAQATLALSLNKLHDSAASTAAMTELIRSFPTRPLPRNVYGPDDEKFYREVYKQVQAMGRGRLSVAAGDSRAVVFIDGQIRGVGSVVLADLVPGTYHVFVQVPQTVGRQYEVFVGANDEGRLDIPYTLDDQLWVSDAWVGFVVPANAPRNVESKLVAEMAKVHRWSGSDKTAVVGTGEVKGSRALVGTLYSNDGAIIFSAGVPFAEATEARLRALAKFLADGTPAQGLDVVKGAEESGRPEDSASSPSRWRTSSKVVAGTSAVLLAGSVVAYLVAPRDDRTKPTYNDYRLPAVYAFTGSSLVGGVAVYLWLRESNDASPLSAGLIGGGVSALLSGAMLVATKENADAPVGQYVRSTYRDTATAGAIIGGAGVALTVTGIVLLHREHTDSIVPIVAFDHGQGTAGFAATF